MNHALISPYIRTAMHSTLVASCIIKTRVLYDYELIYVRSGRCRITVDGTPYLCKKNDAVLLRPGVPHSFACPPDSDFVQPHIHFDPIYSPCSEQRRVSFKDRPDMTKEELALIGEDVLADIPIPTVFVPQEPDRFQKLFFEVIDLFEKKPPGFELLCKARLTELFSLIFAQFEPDRRPETGSGHDEYAIIRSYIDSSYLSPLSLDTLSKQFHLNKFTLTRNFRRRYGMSIIHYYRSLRANYAKKLLTTTNRSVSSIGEELGFSDIYSFSRFFHSFTGMSPTAFRDSRDDTKEVFK
ncbi:MAG: AraC family transcriptional regulator [Clostridia bacterium]|nr:AraC family transcriptional regulator [Clostridia bacterium]